MDFFDTLKEKINKNIHSEEITIIDNTHLHTKHKFFDSEKFHLKLIIKSKKLKNMNKIDAHKEVYAILKNEMIKKIHALEIEIQ
jgi:BolA family transcriptional regulator, general stress-responsive regulator